MKLKCSLVAPTCASLLVAVLLALGAFAAPAHAAPDIPPLAYAKGELTLQISPEMEHGKLGAFVVVKVPENVQLPARVQVPVPAGMHPHWVGEVFPEEPSKDAEVEYTQGTAADGTPYVEFEINRSREVQVEGIIGDLKVEGAKTTFTTAFKNFWDEPEPLSLSVVLPKDRSNLQVAPAITGTPQTSNTGQQLFTLAPTQIQAGESITVTGSYETVTSSEAKDAPSSGMSPVVIAVLVVVGAAVVVLVIWLVIKKRSEPEFYD